MKKRLLLLFAATAALVSSQAEVKTFFSEDFEWLAPWSEAVNAGTTVENDTPGSGDYAPQLTTPKVNDVTALDTLLNRGYKFYRMTPSGPTTAECIYLQKNYLKFGKTGYQAGFEFPSIDVPTDAKNLKLSFVWCPMRKGSGNTGGVDPVALVVSIVNGTDSVAITKADCDSLTHSWANGTPLHWVPITLDLSGKTVTKDTRILVTQEQWGVSTANRWYIDNITLTGEVATSDVVEVATEKVQVSTVAGNFNVVVPEAVTGVKVYNLKGELVASQALKAGNNTVEASALAAGVYVLKFNNGEVVKAVK